MPGCCMPTVVRLLHVTCRLLEYNVRQYLQGKDIGMAIVAVRVHINMCYCTIAAKKWHIWVSKLSDNNSCQHSPGHLVSHSSKYGDKSTRPKIVSHTEGSNFKICPFDSHRGINSLTLTRTK